MKWQAILLTGITMIFIAVLVAINAEMKQPTPLCRCGQRPALGGNK